MNSKINSLLHGEMENYIFPFFWQHGESEAVLRKYMQVIYDANIRAVCIESRPHPDFVGAGWWRDMDIILEEMVPDLPSVGQGGSGRKKSLEETKLR